MALTHNKGADHLPVARPHFWRRLMNKHALPPFSLHEESKSPKLSLDDAPALVELAPALRGVVVGLPRAQTFRRQQSEQRINLVPVIPSADERRAISADRRSRSLYQRVPSLPKADLSLSAPSLIATEHHESLRQDSHPLYHEILYGRPDSSSVTESAYASSHASDAIGDDEMPAGDTMSVTTSRHEAIINHELDRTWILNLSMQFRDNSRREKFFVTYRDQEHHWRRVTISLDYRDAPPRSLEMELLEMELLRAGSQRQKIAKIYEAIRESLPDIQFYDTVTNLKLETTHGRLHVHVVQDGQEIIKYPRLTQLRHLGCRRVKESEIFFDSHMSGFVYRVIVHNHVLIKKDIPSQDTMEEFLYEVNALNALRHTRDVVKLYGVVVDDDDEIVKGLLISYASRGALVDLIYDRCKDKRFELPLKTKERWARQIIQGLADIHEAGFVQGDFTLSNIVVNESGDAKIIDINRRGCPMGWEPPEATPLLEAGHRITMYIGIKSDLYQLGMVLWALAMEDYEPEACPRPLILDPEVQVADWYRQITEICLSMDPRMRLQATTLLELLPPTMKIDEDLQPDELTMSGMHHGDWPYSGRTYVDNSPALQEEYYQLRGRSPPSVLPSTHDGCEASRDPMSQTSWAANRSVRPSYTDVEAPESWRDDVSLLGEERAMIGLTPEERTYFPVTNGGVGNDNHDTWGNEDLVRLSWDNPSSCNPECPSPGVLHLDTQAMIHHEASPGQDSRTPDVMMSHGEKSMKAKAIQCTPDDSMGTAPATRQSSQTVATCFTADGGRAKMHCGGLTCNQMAFDIGHKQEMNKVSRDGQKDNQNSPTTGALSKPRNSTQAHGGDQSGRAEDMTAVPTAASGETNSGLVGKTTTLDGASCQPGFQDFSSNENWIPFEVSEDDLRRDHMPGLQEPISLTVSLAGIGAVHTNHNDQHVRDIPLSI